MANPTTNYGWPMPTATDLVTDLPADFAAFGQPVDTSLKALNPETTLGDMAYRSATANTNTRLAIGSTGQVLTVTGGVPAWGAAPSGSLTVAQIASGTLSGASVTISSLSSYDQLFIQLRNVDMSSVTGMSIRVNNNSGSNYSWNGFSVTPANSTGNTQPVDDTKFMPFYQGNLASSAPDNSSGFSLTNCKSAGFTNASWASGYKNSNSVFMAEAAQGIYKVAEAVSSIVFVANAGTFDGGTYTIWGG